MINLFLEAVFIFILFLFFGSFIGVVVERVIKKKKFITSRSYCDNCKHTLSPLDLVPILSFVFLGGRCRYCRKKISSNLVLIELITAFLGLIYYYSSLKDAVTRLYLSLDIISLATVLLLFLLFIILMSIFFVDYFYMVIPLNFFIILFITLLFLFFLEYFNISDSQMKGFLVDKMYGFAFMFTAFVFLYFITKGNGMGEGDVVLASVLGLYVGLYGAYLIWFISFLTGGIVGVILLLKGKKLEYKLAFGPFLVLGYIFLALFEEYFYRIL